MKNCTSFYNSLPNLHSSYSTGHRTNENESNKNANIPCNKIRNPIRIRTTRLDLIMLIPTTPAVSYIPSVISSVPLGFSFTPKPTYYVPKPRESISIIQAQDTCPAFDHAISSTPEAECVHVVRNKCNRKKKKEKEKKQVKTRRDLMRWSLQFCMRQASPI